MHGISCQKSATKQTCIATSLSTLVTVRELHVTCYYPTLNGHSNNINVTSALAVAQLPNVQQFLTRSFRLAKKR